MAVQDLRGQGRRKNQIRGDLEQLMETPESFLDAPVLDTLAQAVIDDRDFVRGGPVPFECWGDEHIDQPTRKQMSRACEVPVAKVGALMPDAHVGYGLPIGGVLACDNAVIPYAVGVDIGCRMKLSIIDVPVDRMVKDPARFGEAISRNTRFGMGAVHEFPMQHEVMDADWNVTKITRHQKDRAWEQLGTSGSGNHFVEFGVVTVDEVSEDLDLQPGNYVGLLSHSGSRGPGAAVCSTYSSIARSRLSAKYDDLAYLAWLGLDTEEGQDYWAAMQLMGQYAAANHDVIHRLVTKAIGGQTLRVIENFHNFAWLENHNGVECVVHRKGATPAGKGQLGIIPGSMADPAFIVSGRGDGSALHSASHGAGRKLSRRAAKEKYRWNAVQGDLKKKGVHVISAEADEVPGAYKDIRQVMKCQEDLVDVLGRFDPRVVKMCGDGSKAED